MITLDVSSAGTDEKMKSPNLLAFVTVSCSLSLLLPQPVAAAPILKVVQIARKMLAEAKTGYENDPVKALERGKDYPCAPQPLDGVST